MTSAPREPVFDEVRGVLVVDDEVTIREVLSETLPKDLGCPVLKAGHGLEALRLIRRDSEQIDVIILDLAMPVMDGPEFLAALAKEAWPPRAVIVLSGLASSDEARAFFRMDAPSIVPVDFLLKPTTRDKVLGAIALAARALRERLVS